jgi:hypothetical protein
MTPISTLRARLARLEAERPSPVRRFIVVAGTRDQIGSALVAVLEAKGEVTIVTTGVCRDPLDTGPRRPVVYEQLGGAWIAADEALAA